MERRLAYGIREECVLPVGVAVIERSNPASSKALVHASTVCCIGRAQLASCPQTWIASLETGARDFIPPNALERPRMR